MKLRLIDYTYEQPVIIGEYWNEKDLEQAAAAYIREVDGDCDELMSEQYDYHYELWTSFTPATAAMQTMIKSLLEKYFEERVDRSEEH